MAYLHQQGIGIPIDYSKAIHFYDRAILFNHVEALYQRAFLHKYGFGEEHNDEEAIRLFEQAILLGHTGAMNERAEMHYIDLPPNKEAACLLYKKASDLGDSTAMRELGKIYETNKKYLLAVEFYNRSRQSGDIIAIAECARMHALGYTGHINYSKALSLLHLSLRRFERASKNGFVRLDRPDNEQEGLKTRILYDYFYRDAYSSTLTHLAVIHQFGYGCRIDLETAIGFYKRAIQFNNREALHNYALLHQAGQGMPVNRNIAAKLFERASLLGHPGSMNNLGLFYEFADVNRRNYGKALALYKQGQAQGEMYADASVKRLEKKLETITIKKPTGPAFSGYSLFNSRIIFPLDEKKAEEYTPKPTLTLYE